MSEETAAAGSKPPDHRRYERSALAMEVRFTVEGREIGCIIADISVGGALLTGVSGVAMGAAGDLDLNPFGSHECEVVRVKDNAVGVRFKADTMEMTDVIIALATYTS